MSFKVFFYIQTSYIGSKFCQRGRQLFVKSLFYLLYLGSLLQGNIYSGYVFFFTVLYLDGFLTFFTQAAWYKVNKSQSSGSCFCLAFLLILITTIVQFPQLQPLQWDEAFEFMHILNWVSTGGWVNFKGQSVFS